MSIDRTPKPCMHKRARHGHGTREAYVLDRCRCLPCAAANSTYENQRARLHAYGRGTPTGLVDAAPVRAHVQALQATGMGWKPIAAAAGVHDSAVSRLLYGRKRSSGRIEPPTQRLNPDTARRLLAIPLPGLDQLPGGVRVDPTGTARRLQALACLGWSVNRVAAESDLNRQALDGALHGRQVVAATARAVVELYGRLWDQRPVPGDRFGAGGITRTINAATRAGWVPPLAWDDDTIDDPRAESTRGDVDEDLVDGLAVDHVLEGVRLQLTGATLHAAVHALAAAGHQPAAIAERLGTYPEQVARLRARAEPPRANRSAA